MSIRDSYSRHVEAYEKSIELGGARVLFPVEPSLTNGFATQIKMAIEEAERAAYDQGVQDTQAAMCKALGIVR